MSKQTITREVDAVVCDFCNQEVDINTDGYCYSDINRKSHNADLGQRQKYGVKHLIFHWLRPSAKSVKLGDYVRYDFHAACFDKLMVKFLAERDGAEAL